MHVFVSETCHILFHIRIAKLHIYNSKSKKLHFRCFGKTFFCQLSVTSLQHNIGLGESADKKGCETFTKVEGLFNIVEVAAGLRHAVAVDKDGRAWGWGAAGKGQIGYEASGGKLLKAPKIFGPAEAVRGVSCGQYFTLLTTETKMVEGHGDNKHGQLDASSHSVPYHQISCGWTHAVVLQDNVVGGWGRNNYHQLGGNKLGGVKKIATGSEHCLALTSQNQVLAWGWNEHGNCGQDGEDDVETPTLVKGLEGKITTDIFSGSAHSFAIIE